MSDSKALLAPDKLILASASPRRLEICRALGLEPEVMLGDCPEITEGLPQQIVLQNARNKALALSPKIQPRQLLLAADTVVEFKGRVLGKPQNQEEAASWLGELSGAWHRVYTGMALLDENEKLAQAYRCTQVKFAVLDEADIQWYLKTGEPMDKAGAYGIQGKGGMFIEEIKGDYGTVVGLCPRLLFLLGEELGYDLKTLVKFV